MCIENNASLYSEWYRTYVYEITYAYLKEFGVVKKGDRTSFLDFQRWLDKTEEKEMLEEFGVSVSEIATITKNFNSH